MQNASKTNNQDSQNVKANLFKNSYHGRKRDVLQMQVDDSQSCRGISFMSFDYADERPFLAQHSQSSFSLALLLLYPSIPDPVATASSTLTTLAFLLV